MLPRKKSSALRALRAAATTSSPHRDLGAAGSTRAQGLRAEGHRQGAQLPGSAPPPPTGDGDPFPFSPFPSPPLPSHPFPSLPRLGRARDGHTPGTGRRVSLSEGRPAAGSGGEGGFLGGARAAAAWLGVCAWCACSRLPRGSGNVSCLQPAPARNGEMEFKQRSWVSRALNWSFAQSLRAIESIWKSIYRQCGGQIMDSSQ